MALFTGMPSGGYPRGRMPLPEKSDGPWGEAIQYWLAFRGWKQADLIREIQKAEPSTSKTDKKNKGNKNTVSNAALGRDCNTRTLRVIATALNVPLDAVLVSPDRKSANEARKQMIMEITESVVRKIEQPQWPPQSGAAAPVAPADAGTPLSPNRDAIEAATRGAIAAEEQRRAAQRQRPRQAKRKTGSKRTRRRFGNN